jgi:DNA-binding transcriptional LysR family regulator
MAKAATSKTRGGKSLEEASKTPRKAVGRSASTPGDRLELIETFIRIAETGGIGAAARSLETTQPTVSRRLQQLESMLSAQLVERNNQGLSLTSVGAQLLPEAREMVARWCSLESAVSASDTDLAGHVRLLCATEMGSRLLPPILAEFLRRHPGVRIETRFRDVVSDLLSDGADLALIEGKLAAEGVVSMEIGKTRDILCASPAMASELEARHGLNVSRCEPLALEGSPMITVGDRYGATIGFTGRGGEQEDASFDIIAEVDGVDAALILALEGCGVALLPDWRATPFFSSGKLSPVSVDWAAETCPITLCWSPTRLRAAPAAALLELIRTALPGLLIPNESD